jgi:hypothetical protein
MSGRGSTGWPTGPSKAVLALSLVSMSEQKAVTIPSIAVAAVIVGLLPLAFAQIASAALCPRVSESRRRRRMRNLPVPARKRCAEN